MPAITSIPVSEFTVNNGQAHSSESEQTACVDSHAAEMSPSLDDLTSSEFDSVMGPIRPESLRLQTLIDAHSVGMASDASDAVPSDHHMQSTTLPTQGGSGEIHNDMQPQRPAMSSMPHTDPKFAFAAAGSTLPTPIVPTWPVALPNSKNFRTSHTRSNDTSALPGAARNDRVSISDGDVSALRRFTTKRMRFMAQKRVVEDSNVTSSQLVDRVVIPAEQPIEKFMGSPSPGLIWRSLDHQEWCLIKCINSDDEHPKSKEEKERDVREEVCEDNHLFAGVNKDRSAAASQEQVLPLTVTEARLRMLLVEGHQHEALRELGLGRKLILVLPFASELMPGVVPAYAWVLGGSIHGASIQRQRFVAWWSPAVPLYGFGPTSLKWPCWRVRSDGDALGSGRWVGHQISAATAQSEDKGLTVRLGVQPYTPGVRRGSLLGLSDRHRLTQALSSQPSILVSVGPFGLLDEPEILQ